MAADGTIRGEREVPRGFGGLSRLASDVSGDLGTAVVAVADGMTRGWPREVEEARWATDALYPAKHPVASALGALVAKASLFASDDQAKAGQLFGCAKTVGRAFLVHALEQGMVSAHPTLFTGMIHPPDSALRLGYVLVAGAYGSRNDGRRRVLTAFSDWFREVLARQQFAGKRRMAGVFSEIASRHGVSTAGFPFMQPGPEDREPMRSAVDSRHSSAEKAIAGIIGSVRANARYPLQPAYEDLVAAFGGPGDAPELERRYGAILMRLFTDARRVVASV